MFDRKEFLNLSPAHIKLLDSRLETLMILKGHIQDTIETFNKYAIAGKNLCSCMAKLSQSFICEEFKFDPTLQSISNLLDSFRETLFDHYSQIKDHIINPLSNFVNNDIKTAEEAGKTRATYLDFYNKALENFVSLKKGKNVKEGSNIELEGLEVKLMQAHGQAVVSDFMLHHSLELVERKKLIEITATFLAFINLLCVSYRQCVFDYDESRPEFATLQLSFPESTKYIKNYENNMNNDLKILQQQQQLYWAAHKEKFTSTDLVDYEGYLWKKGSGFTKSWRKRYFICRNGDLSYYHDENDISSPKGKLNLLLTSVKPIKDPERRFTFTIISQAKVYTLQAITQYDMDMWMAVIMNNIQYLLDHTDAKMNSTREIQNEIGENNINHENHISLLQNILDKPENKHCADCGSTMPSWCCINWGTCICIHCSGVHRSLTTSVSKVRSLSLDRLDHYTTLLLNAIGNKNANEILEKQLVGKDEDAIKDLRENRESFIKLKYLDCCFADDSEQIDMRTAIMNNDILNVFKAICIIKKHGEKFFIFPTKDRMPISEEKNIELEEDDDENDEDEKLSNQQHHHSDKKHHTLSDNDLVEKKKKRKSKPSARKSEMVLLNKKNVVPTESEAPPVGYTWLHLAASVGNPLITLLIAYNIDNVNVLDEGGWSPLSYASFYGNSEVAEALLGNGSDPNLSKVAHPYFVAKSLQNQSLAAIFSPFWHGSMDIQPKKLKPPVEILRNDNKQKQ